MHVIVTGGAGFLGSHLCRALLRRGDRVTCVDNFSSGRTANLSDLTGAEGFSLVRADVVVPLRVAGPVDAVTHLASPASPPDYHRLPLETLAVGSRGTENALDLAALYDARFVLASTSEVYGDPLTHPQREDYWGNVNPIGPRSVYDEAKRYAEAVTAAYARNRGLNAGIVRIFNTYGPMMRARDGRVVTSFIAQALTGMPLTVYGDGGQTRSFCYVDDLVRGLVAMIDSGEPGPVNLGNPNEVTMLELADRILTITGSDVPLRFLPLPVDDPTRRKPDIDRAERLLGWRPEVDTETGLRLTVESFRSRMDEVRRAAAELTGVQSTAAGVVEPAGTATPAVAAAL